MVKATVEQAQARALGRLTGLAEARRVLDEEIDRVVRETVEHLRANDTTWQEIGDAAGVSKQAAQWRFGQQGVSNVTPKVEPSQLARLWDGEEHALASIPRSSDGSAGVATIWMDGSCIGVTHARAAAECRQSNEAQANGINGRLLKYRQQPPKAAQRALLRACPDLLAQHTSETSLQKQASAALRAYGAYRVVETPDGRSAKALADEAKAVLQQQASHEAPIRDADVAWMSTMSTWPGES